MLLILLVSNSPEEAVSNRKALQGSSVNRSRGEHLIKSKIGLQEYLIFNCLWNLPFLSPGKFSLITPVYAVSVSMRHQWWWPFRFLLVGTGSEIADGDTLTRTEKKIVEKRMGDKWSLQWQRNLWATGLSHFLGRCLLLWGITVLEWKASLWRSVCMGGGDGFGLAIHACPFEIHCRCNRRSLPMGPRSGSSKCAPYTSRM